jgi:hypothetical protein
VLALIPLLILSSCHSDGNAVLRYLDNSELQYEGETQEANLEEALSDILLMDEGSLRIQRYKDYAGQDNQWDLPTLLSRHFVPADQSYTFGDSFYTEIKSHAVARKIREILASLE